MNDYKQSTLDIDEIIRLLHPLKASCHSALKNKWRQKWYRYTALQQLTRLKGLIFSIYIMRDAMLPWKITQRSHLQNYLDFLTNEGFS